MGSASYRTCCEPCFTSALVFDRGACLAMCRSGFSQHGHCYQQCVPGSLPRCLLHWRQQLCILVHNFLQRVQPSAVTSTFIERESFCRDPKMRPSIHTVAKHPCWWAKSVKLQFLIDASDAFELADRATDDTLLKSIEAAAPSAFPPGSNWATTLEQQLICNLHTYRTYKYSSVRDLLRVVRNKFNHFREMPKDLQVCSIV
jgi:Ribonuclease 2-5A